MGRSVLFGIFASLVTAVDAQQDAGTFEVEPALLPQNLTNESLSAKSATPAPVLDISQLEKDLARARKRAAGAEHLFKIGALAKVEAESSALRVIRLEAELENARLAYAKERALTPKSQVRPDETVKADATQTDSDLARAIHSAHAAAAKREHAELEAAAMNLFRQQKLLALGSGSKTSVRRAEEKLAELREKTP